MASLELDKPLPENGQLHLGNQLPSFNDSFGKLVSQTAPTQSHLRCSTCRAHGQTVWVLQGTPCNCCGKKECLTPPPDLPSSYQDLPCGTPRESRYFVDVSQPAMPEVDVLSRRSSMVYSTPSRQVHDVVEFSRSKSASPLLPAPQMSNRFQPSPRASISLDTTLYQPQHQMFSTTAPPLIQGSTKPACQRSEKDARHCDAEKARRDHQITYINISSSLRGRFRWPEERTSSPEPPSDSPSNEDPLLNPATESSAGDHKPAPVNVRKKAEKLTKQRKLQQQVLWEFRTCLRFNTTKVREWLDEVRQKGEEQRRMKMESLEEDEANEMGVGRGIKRKSRKNELRSVKDEALLEVSNIMEKEFWIFCSGTQAGSGWKGADVCLDGGRSVKRKRSAGDVDVDGYNFVEPWDDKWD